MPNAHNRQENGAGGAPADHFAQSRRRIEDDEVTLDTIAGRSSEHGNARSEQERASHWATGWGRQQRRADRCRFSRMPLD